MIGGLGWDGEEKKKRKKRAPDWDQRSNGHDKTTYRSNCQPNRIARSERRRPCAFIPHFRVCHHGSVIDWSRQFNHSRAICFSSLFSRNCPLPSCLGVWDGGLIARRDTVCRINVKARKTNQSIRSFWVHGDGKYPSHAYNKLKICTRVEAPRIKSDIKDTFFV